MRFTLRLIPAAAAACALAACGGGDAGAPPGLTPPAALPSTGVAVDGYLNGATTLCDANGNGTADTGEVTTLTGADGRFTFSPGCGAALVVYGGTSTDTNLPFKGVLKAPAGAAVVSPLTSLVAAGMTPAQVLATLGLPATTDLLTTDPALRGNGALVNGELFKKTLALQQLVQKAAEVMARLGNATDLAAQQAIHAEVATAFGVLLKGGGTLVAGTSVDDSLVANLVKAAADRVAASTTVPAAVRSAVAAVNAQALGVVTAGALKFQAEAFLKAVDANVVTVATAQQTDAAIATFVAANTSALTAAPGAAATTLGATLTAQVAGTGSGGGDTGGGGTGGGGTGGGDTGGGDTGGGTGTPPTIDFSGATVGLVAFGSDGGGYAILAADPTSAANKVAKIVKQPGDQVWAGATVYSNLAATTIAPVVLSATSKTITVRVYSPAVGEKVLLKLEKGAGGAPDQEVEVSTTRANAWETLTFNFPATGTYAKLSLFPHFNTAVAAELAFYFDDLTYPVTGDTATPPAPTNHLALVGDSLSLVNGSTVTAYTMAQFQSEAGIAVKWPLPSPMVLRVSVAEVGTYVLPAGQKLTAAMAISETTATGKAEVLGYINNVAVTKTDKGLNIAVPASGAEALVYGVSSDARKKAVIDFGASVAKVQNTLLTSSGSINNILLGNVVNYAINQVSNDFTGIYSLRGKYKVSLVIDGLPLRKADGSELPRVTINVPTVLSASGAVEGSKTISGPGLVGFINLTD